MSPPLPLWITSLELNERDANTRVFYLKVAALYATPAGSLPALAKRLMRSHTYLTLICSNSKPASIRGRIPVKDAILIEQIVGRDVITRELLCPEVFHIDETTT